MADEALVGAADVNCRSGVGQTERGQRLSVAECGPASRGRPRARIGGEQVVGVAESEGLATAATVCGAFPAGQRRLRVVDFIGGKTIEKIIAGVKGAHMIEAEKLPAAFGAGEAIRSRRAEFAGCRAAGMVAPRRLGAFDTAVQALGALWRFGRFGGDGRRSLAIPAVDYRRRQ
jgi:hypothetical protein